jgi:hypothetical protein
LYKYSLDFRTFKYRGIKKLRSKFTSPILVVANGPSVNSFNFDNWINLRKRGLKIMALNSYYKSELWEMVKPDFYVLSDPAHKKDLEDPSKFMEKYQKYST